MMNKARTGCLLVRRTTIYCTAHYDQNTHGTGCTLSAALAALRPRHTNWADTVQEAKSWLSSALARPTRWKLVTVLVRFTTSTRGGEHLTIAALVIVSLWR